MQSTQILPEEDDRPKFGKAMRQQLTDYFLTAIGMAGNPDAMDLRCQICGELLCRVPSRYTFDRQEAGLTQFSPELLPLITDHHCNPVTA
jgi:hypothetical protein